ncbi:hypothetical protein [Ruegeria sp.]|uniref:hypothetical protein n=1 Tax=Ruegeria sp. TaxID=1879320 RepID=UPI003B590A12
MGALKPLLWRDPSDLATMFQDAAATIPVTSAGDPVKRINNKGTLGGHFLAPSDDQSPIYQTDGTHHWVESDGVNDILEFQGAVPFSVNVFEAVAFRTIALSRAFPHIINHRGGGTNDPQQRQPLIFTLQSAPARIVCSFGGVQNAVTTGASLVGVDTIVTTSNTAAVQTANVNGKVSTAAGVTLTEGNASPYSIFGPNSARIRDYGGIHMNRVPTAGEEKTIRAYYAARSAGTA